MRVLIADDHPLYLRAVREHLERLFPGIAAESATNLASALGILRDCPPQNLVLLDYSMPGMIGYAGVRAVVTASHGAPVVVMSGIASADEISTCIGAGAKGFIPKSFEGEIFASALNIVLAGGSYLPAEMFSRAPPPPTESPADGVDFTERERTVMAMVVSGKSNKEIARLLTLQEVTIKVQLTHLYKKLGAKNRAQATMLAVQQHLVD